MFALVMKAVFLVVLTFTVFSWIGWKISGLVQLKSDGTNLHPNMTNLNAQLIQKQADSSGYDEIVGNVVHGQFSSKNMDHLEIEIMTMAHRVPKQIDLAINDPSEPERPELLVSPNGRKDDLKIISGIGPVNEKELNELGIFHYWQIAHWTPKNIAWISQRIRFPMRIVRENWMAQAANLMRKN